MSDCAVNAGEPCRGCAGDSANGGNLRAKAYGYPVRSPEMGTCNDYQLVTEYNAYWHGVGSARRLFQKFKFPSFFLAFGVNLPI